MVSDLRAGGSHNDWILNPLKLHQLVHMAVRVMNENGFNKETVDALVCSGMSGAGVAFPLSMLTEIPVWIVRKEREQTHSGSNVEFQYDALKDKQSINYLVVDDFISSGATVKRILEYMDGLKDLSQSYYHVSEVTCKGLVLYMCQRLDNPDHYKDHEGRIIPKYACQVY